MNSDANDIQIGTILRGTYEVVSLLGTGGMGKVFLARHLRLPSKQVAVKVLVSDEALTADQYARFGREAEITSRLTHPNIVGILDYHGMETEGGSPFLVLEHLNGETLSRRIRKGPIPLPEALFIARQIGSALHAAHQTGIIHRDLKPGNVFLVPTESWDVADYQVKLLDFGISKLVSSHTMRTRDDVLLGTPRYMSPEQAKGQNSKVDARSDLFALAVIVHEMIVGKSPFADDTVVGIIYRVVNEPAPALDTLLPDVPAPVAAAVARALSKQPEDRQPSIAAFIEELTGTLSPSFAPVSGIRPALTGDAYPSQDTGRSRTGPVVSSVAAPPPPTLPPTPSLSSPTASPAAPSLAAPAEPSLAAPVTPPRKRSLVLPGAVLALLLGAGSAALLWPRQQPPLAPATAPAPVARAVPAPEPTPEQRAPTESTAAEPTAAEPTAAEPTPSDEPAPSEPASVAAAPQPARAPATPRNTEAMPETVRQILKEAESALSAGNPQEAIRLARLSQRTALTGASFALLTRAHCRHGDLTNVRTQWNRVPAALRPAVRQYCQRYDIEL